MRITTCPNITKRSSDDALWRRRPACTAQPTTALRRCPRLHHKLAAAVRRFVRRTHRDQGGSISILAVFAVLMLTMVLGMIVNVGRQVDGKLRMQNAADAAAYSGGLVMARGLNSLAFTNHLLCEVFAMTLIMREGRDRHSDPYVPDILAAWDNESSRVSAVNFSQVSVVGQRHSGKNGCRATVGHRVQQLGGGAGGRPPR